MDELRAALGLVQIERLLGWNDDRRALTARYRVELARAVPQVQVPFDPDHVTAAHILPVILPAGCDRGAVMATMRERGVQTSAHYPPIHEFSYYRRMCGSTALPRTAHFGERELTLPLHPALSTADVDRVVAALGDAVGLGLNQNH
jgi:dTDP-4-amino-4,6-dideoxygalactose transaminase